MSRAPGDWTVRLEIDPTAWIAPGAVVTGEVKMGARSSVWFASVVRGDSAPTVIGDDTNLQDGTIVHQDEGEPAILGARVTVGHRALLHGCRIEDDCLIGMGAIVLTGAHIGTGSLVAAGSLVREGQHIPPGSLVVGSPARVAGPVSDRHRAAIENGARHYAELAQSYVRRGIARPHPARHDPAGTAAPACAPMSRFEWEGLIEAMRIAPRRVEEAFRRVDGAELRRTPAPGSWSALEVLCHLRDADREVYLPRIDRMLAEDLPFVPAVDLTGWPRERKYQDDSPAAAFETWRGDRERLVARLAPLGPAEWRRTAIHSVRGPFPLGDMVREWVEHDLSHVAQIARALGASA